MDNNKILILVAIAAVVCMRTGVTAVSSPPPTSYKTLYDLMSSTAELSVALSLFNYTGLIPLLKDPNTMITCFLPNNATPLEDYLGWDLAYNEQGRYVWAMLLQHCVDGQKALTLKQLPPNLGDGSREVNYFAAFPMWQTPFWIENTNGSTYFYGEEGDPGKVIKADMKGGKSIIHLIDNGNQYPSIPPPDSFDTVLDYLQYEAPIAYEVFSASSLVPFLTDAERSTNITVFGPTDAAFASLLGQLRISKETLLSKKALVDLLTKAHIINGSALYTGSLISYGSPIRLQTLAGPLNATGDLTIFPKRSGPAKMVILSNPYVKAGLSDYDVGGNDNLDPPKFVAHFVDKVLLPISLKDLQKLSAKP